VPVPNQKNERLCVKMWARNIDSVSD